ncbi:mucin TcMUCII, putative [Trypanosoma cruzi marinkellei]|uniref:Mucin TcMUCII, putative n=1 Tax=Trypanosoma cruzi marinkellei TaxID=85056 RepID=K2N3D0_TRYCR|nr:mucin TcMUCII, putative [Trypanosoma cruzi marinkellei]
MMTTCRLLCALLVLALCCCPSACAAGSDGVEEDGLSGPSPPLQKQNLGPNPQNEDHGDATPLPSPEAHTTLHPKTQVDAKGKDIITPSATAEEGLRSTGGSESLSPGHAAAKGNPATPMSSAPAAEVSKKTETASRDEDTLKKVKTPEDPLKTTTTTTTRAPTTTTTTTAPEAPTTTTTRAPSRLREIDGSLSSSAWVCAPLLLAVSALAYTALG